MRPLPCPAGQGALRECVFDAVCLAGKGAAEWRAGSWVYRGRKLFAGRFALERWSGGAPGGRKHAVLRSTGPPSSRNHPAGSPAGSARTRSRVQTLEDPFLGSGVCFPRLPSQKPPQADGPCSWAVRRVCALPPEQKRNEASPPPAHGADLRDQRAEGTGRRHCRPPGPPSPRLPTAAGGKSLLVDLPPSARTSAPSETKRSTQAPCSWGLGACTCRRRLLAAGTAGPP